MVDELVDDMEDVEALEAVELVLLGVTVELETEVLWPKQKKHLALWKSFLIPKGERNPRKKEVAAEKKNPLDLFR